MKYESSCQTYWLVWGLPKPTKEQQLDQENIFGFCTFAVEKSNENICPCDSCYNKHFYSSVPAAPLHSFHLQEEQLVESKDITLCNVTPDACHQRLAQNHSTEEHWLYDQVIKCVL